MFKRIGMGTVILFALLFVFGAALFVRGIEDLGLLVAGSVMPGKITNVETRHIRVGKRGSGTKLFVKYEFVLDGKTYSGGGDYPGASANPGEKMPVRYLSFAPTVNAPEDEVAGPGLFLTAAGGILAVAVVAGFRRKIRGEGSSPKDKRDRDENEPSDDSAIAARKKPAKKKKK